jgi:acyl carrier protein
MNHRAEYTNRVAYVTDPALLARLRGIISEIAGPGRAADEIGVETPLRDGGLWLDSVALLELIVAVEAAFEVDFDPTSDFGDSALQTVGSLAIVIERRLRGR